MKRQLQPRNGKVKKAKIQETCRVAFFSPRSHRSMPIIPFGERESSEVSLIGAKREGGSALSSTHDLKRNNSLIPFNK